MRNLNYKIFDIIKYIFYIKFSIRNTCSLTINILKTDHFFEISKI